MSEENITDIRQLLLTVLGLAGSTSADLWFISPVCDMIWLIFLGLSEKWLGYFMSFFSRVSQAGEKELEEKSHWEMVRNTYI